MYREDLTGISGAHPDTIAVIKHFRFRRLPVEGTLYTSTYRSTLKTRDGNHMSTAMIGMYSELPLSVSCFHKLSYDEIWHFYGGDPFALILLYPDGSDVEIIMGSDIVKGQKVQFIVPANVWQAGFLLPGGRYGLFGCTMAPGFTGSFFEAGVENELIERYPRRREDIVRLSVNGSAVKMLEDFSG